MKVEAEGRLQVQKQRVLLNDTSSLAPQDTALLIRESDKLREEIDAIRTSNLDNVEELQSSLAQ